MNVGAPFIPKPETTVLMNPTDRPLHHPAELPQAAAMLGPLLSQQRIDSELTEALAVGFGVIRSVPQHGVGTTLGMPRLAGYGRNRVAQRRQLIDLVDVGCRRARGQWDALGLGHHMVFAPRFAAVHRAGAGPFAAVGRPHEGGIDRRPRPIELVGGAEPTQEDLVDLQPGPIGLPIAEPSPARHATTAPQLTGQILPGNAGLEYEEDPRQHLAIVEPRLSPFGAWRPLGQDWLDDLPQFVRQQGLGHD